MTRKNNKARTKGGISSESKLKQLEQIIKKEMLKLNSLKMIYLYGSVLLQAFNNESDIDCAIHCNESDFKTGLFDIKPEIELTLKRDLDLVNIKTANPDFATEIIASGKLIYTKDQLFKDKFEMRILSEYLTLEEDRAIVLENIYKTGRVF